MLRADSFEKTLILGKIEGRRRRGQSSTCLFIIGDWNARVGIQEIPGVTGKFGLGIQMKQGKG